MCQGLKGIQRVQLRYPRCQVLSFGIGVNNRLKHRQQPPPQLPEESEDIFIQVHVFNKWVLFTLTI